LNRTAQKKDGRERLVLGECEKVAAKNRWAITSDFTITLFRNNLVGLSEEQIKTVMFHELLHVGIEPGADGEETYSVRSLQSFKPSVSVKAMVHAVVLPNKERKAEPVLPD